MSQAINDPAQSQNRRFQWVARIEAVIQQIQDWATAEGWATARAERKITEREFGQYDAPILRVRLPGGEINVIPVALNVIGADGRIDIEAFPSLNRVKMIGRGDHWEILTDSNVPLREQWNSQTFVQLAKDLVA